MDEASGQGEADRPGAPALGEVFSPETEARVCELVLGDRRHGLPVPRPRKAPAPG